MNRLLLISLLVLTVQHHCFPMIAQIEQVHSVAAQVPFLLAVQYGSLADVKKILIDGADVNACDANQMTALHYAAQSEDTALVDFLLDSGAQLTAQDRSNMTPLHHAAMKGTSGVVRELLKEDGLAQSVLNKVDVHGRTALHYAAIRGNVEVLRELLNVKPHNEVRDVFGFNALDCALSSNHGAVVKLLLAQRGWGDLSTHPHYLIQQAIAQLRRPVTDIPMKFILEACTDCHKARLLITAKLPDVNTMDAYKRTLLHYVAASSRIDLIKLLLQLGADFNAMDESGATPLLFALSEHADSKPSVETIRELITAGADVNARDYHGAAPLHLASSCGSVSIVLALMQANAMVDALDEDYSTPLHKAAQAGNELIAKILLGHNARQMLDRYGMSPFQHSIQRANATLTHLLLPSNINVSNRKGRTPLHDVFSAPLAQMLLVYGAALNAQDLGGRTPLYCAALAGLADVVSVLLKEGANVWLADRFGNTPLHAAAQAICSGGKYAEVIQLLLKYKASIEVLNADNETPYELATNMHRLDIAALLKPKKEQ